MVRSVKMKASFHFPSLPIITVEFLLPGMPTIQEILEKFKEFHPQGDVAIIEKAYQFAQKAHWGQKRLSGQDRLEHLLRTAYTLVELKLDSTSLAGGLLHDILEYTSITLEQIKKEFGNEIASLVEGITFVDKIRHHHKDNETEKQIENLRKIFLAMAKDIRVVLIKLADRLHNMQTLYALPEEKQKRLAYETLEIYAPLADRLGIGRLHGKLQDLAFQYLMPGEYYWLVNQVRDKYLEREKYLEKITPYLEKELLKENIKPTQINRRAKHYYSLYLKLKRYEMNLNQIYDLVALRVIVPTVGDCYTTLGVIHKLWRPLPGRIKDYIALPKPNSYQSIHTTVFCQDGKITEIQIRTMQMHEEAERGIAAHWYYSKQKGLKAYLKKIFTPAPEKELKWIQQLQKWQKETHAPPDEFYQFLKIDFFQDRIFVFTPKGDVIDLPEGATPLDFAYQIHSDIGHHCQGAKVDGKMVALNTPLHNGQVVEIITQKNARPSRDWLKIAKTHQALDKIRQWLSKNQKQTTGETPRETKEEVKKELSRPDQPIKTATRQITLKPAVEVAGDPKIAASLAKCCSPQPPDDIVGYITLNQRITVHKRNCHNLTKIKDPKRLISVNWKKEL